MAMTPYASDDSDVGEGTSSSSMRRHLDLSPQKADPDVLAPIVDPVLASRRVHYYHSPLIGSFSYGYGHPMKPHRMRMAHSLITAYGLDQAMTVREPKEADKVDMSRFHTDEYVDFLERVTPENGMALTGQGTRFLIGEDCPPFPSVFQFCSLSSGGSISAANSINSGAADIAINWAGGLHHAKKREASGFCYTNDIVLGILELLKVHPRVLYIDVDIHHGDGVEEAFYSTNRVLTLSFHKFGDFFPGTGDVRDVGIGEGKGYAINVPLRDGVGDEDYQGKLFRPVIQHIMDWYRPAAVVLQCGADSLAGDKLGCFNLSMRGHAACVSFLQSFNVPLICVGGGGYTVRNVARTWTYETALLLGREPDEDLPYNDYMQWFGPEYKLDVRPTSMENLNSDAYLQGLRSRVIDNLRSLPFAPSVQTHQVPKYAMNAHAEGDLSDSDHEGELEKRITNRIHQARHQQHLFHPPSDSESDSADDDPCGVSSKLKRTASTASTARASRPPIWYSGNSTLDANARQRDGLFEREGSAASGIGTAARASKSWLGFGYTPTGSSRRGHGSGSGPPAVLQKILASQKAAAAVSASINGNGRRSGGGGYDSDADEDASADERSAINGGADVDMTDDERDPDRRYGDDDEYDAVDAAGHEAHLQQGTAHGSSSSSAGFLSAAAMDDDAVPPPNGLTNGLRHTAESSSSLSKNRTKMGRPRRSFFDSAKPYRRAVAAPAPVVPMASSGGQQQQPSTSILKDAVMAEEQESTTSASAPAPASSIPAEGEQEATISTSTPTAAGAPDTEAELEAERGRRGEGGGSIVVVADTTIVNGQDAVVPAQQQQQSDSAAAATATTSTSSTDPGAASVVEDPTTAAASSSSVREEGEVDAADAGAADAAADTEMKDV